MMTRLKRNKKKHEDPASSAFIEKISKLSYPALIANIDGGDNGSNYSRQELIYIIECKKLPLHICRAAYLSLVIHGATSDLQRLSHVMDFSCKDGSGNDAFRLAAIYGRIDVMHWLCENVETFKNIPAEERTNIILHVVTNNREDVLEELAKPVAEGGFGWDLNVRHQNGFTPVKMAMKDNNKLLMLRLIAPVDHGGFGLKLEKHELRRLHQRNEFALFSGSMVPHYHRSKPGKRPSSLSLISPDSTDASADIYKPVSALGAGAYGSVRLFASQKDTSRTLAVKQMGERVKSMSLSGFDVYNFAKDAVNEVECLQRVYPDEGPYKLQHYVIKDGTSYDYRMVMPFVPGERFAETVLATRTAEDLARYFLAIVTELQRIHELGLVHGDARPRNILATVTRDESSGAEYKVHFIDFYQAKNIGARAEIYTDVREDIPPEQLDDKRNVRVHPSQDIFTLGFFMNSAVKHFRKQLGDQFPSIIRFCESATKVNPADRPTLRDFIRELKAELLTRHCEPRVVCGPSQ